MSTITLKYFQAQKEVEYQLFRLYQNENMIKNYEQDLEDRKKEVAKVESKKEKAEEVVKEKKKEQGKASRDLAKVEQEIREIVRLNFYFSPSQLGSWDLCIYISDQQFYIIKYIVYVNY